MKIIRQGTVIYDDNNDNLVITLLHDYSYTEKPGYNKDGSIYINKNHQVQGFITTVEKSIIALLYDQIDENTDAIFWKDSTSYLIILKDKKDIGSIRYVDEISLEDIKEYSKFHGYNNIIIIDDMSEFSDNPIAEGAILESKKKYNELLINYSINRKYIYLLLFFMSVLSSLYFIEDKFYRGLIFEKNQRITLLDEKQKKIDEETSDKYIVYNDWKEHYSNNIAKEILSILNMFNDKVALQEIQILDHKDIIITVQSKVATTNLLPLNLLEKIKDCGYIIKTMNGKNNVQTFTIEKTL